jgi:hypothetical protein
MRGPPKMLAHFGSPAPRFRGAFGVLDRRFAGRFRGLSSMRRTATPEGQMTTIQQHPHAAFDRFPQLVRDLIDEFGVEGIGAVVERFIEAERADFTGMDASRSVRSGPTKHSMKRMGRASR